MPDLLTKLTYLDLELLPFHSNRTELRYAADVPTTTIGVSAATGEPSATFIIDFEHFDEKVI